MFSHAEMVSPTENGQPRRDMVGRRYVQNGWPSPLTSERSRSNELWTLSTCACAYGWPSLAAGLTICVAEHCCGADHYCWGWPSLWGWPFVCRQTHPKQHLNHASTRTWSLGKIAVYTSIFCNCSFIIIILVPIKGCGFNFGRDCLF